MIPSQDSSLGISLGFVLPPANNPPSDELIIQIIAPTSMGWTGISLGGSMTSGLLLTMWSQDGIVISARRSS